MFNVFEHFEAGKKIGTGPANYTDVKKVPPGTFNRLSIMSPGGGGKVPQDVDPPPWDISINVP